MDEVFYGVKWAHELVRFVNVSPGNGFFSEISKESSAPHPVTFHHKEGANYARNSS